jgi:hypothetical protein
LKNIKTIDVRHDPVGVYSLAVGSMLSRKNTSLFELYICPYLEDLVRVSIFWILCSGNVGFLPKGVRLRQVRSADDFLLLFLTAAGLQRLFNATSTWCGGSGMLISPFDREIMTMGGSRRGARGGCAPTAGVGAGT